jgi:YhcH/YjgK/YiaL family protein
MIKGSLKNTARIEAVDVKFEKFFTYLRTLEMSQFDEGTVELDGRDLFVISASMDGKKPEEAVLEAHRKYIDIQLLLEGEERIGWKSLEDAEEESGPYDVEKDLIFYKDQPDDYIGLKPGQFAIFFPEDLHAPAVSNGNIRKMIVKVRV